VGHNAKDKGDMVYVFTIMVSYICRFSAWMATFIKGVYALWKIAVAFAFVSADSGERMAIRDFCRPSR